MKENPLTMEMLLDQLIGLDIIQYAAIPMISFVILEWILTIVQKKITQQLRHSIGHFIM
jgi:antibiotic biosynthesis monooxygenase (ABM) superfamily enzyme